MAKEKVYKVSDEISKNAHIDEKKYNFAMHLCGFTWKGGQIFKSIFLLITSILLELVIITRFLLSNLM